MGLLPFWFWLGDNFRPALEFLGGRLGNVALHLPWHEATATISWGWRKGDRGRRPLG